MKKKETLKEQRRRWRIHHKARKQLGDKIRILSLKRMVEVPSPAPPEVTNNRYITELRDKWQYAIQTTIK